MRSILILGAGRSSSCLIDYLLRNAPLFNWMVLVGDLSPAAAQQRIGSSPYGRFVLFDINQEEESRKVISKADVVISLLPANLHPKVAVHCLACGKHLLTASYVSDEMKRFHHEAVQKGLLFLNECGLDPGIDHMTAMQIIDGIRAEGGKITSFESFTGGLIAPDTDPENPWRYKFTWNPRNVVMAGQSVASFLQSGKLKYIPYQQLFKRVTKVDVTGYGRFEGYANRDSLKYIDTYGLEGIETMLRGTLRNEGYCSAWNLLVQLGCCDDSYVIKNSNRMTHAEFLNCFLDASDRTVREKLISLFSLNETSPELDKLEWSGFFDHTLIGLPDSTPAQIVEHILNKKWKLNARDKDMIIMWHRFYYTRGGEEKQMQASLVAQGDDAVYTAMAKTVGLPLAIAAKNLVNGDINLKGVHIPVSRELYRPILSELKTEGVEMVEHSLS